MPVRLKFLENIRKTILLKNNGTRTKNCYITTKECENTLIYNLTSAPQIKGFLLADVVILSKANPCSGSERQKRNNSES